MKDPRSEATKAIELAAGISLARHLELVEKYPLAFADETAAAQPTDIRDEAAALQRELGEINAAIALEERDLYVVRKGIEHGSSIEQVAFCKRVELLEVTRNLARAKARHLRALQFIQGTAREPRTDLPASTDSRPEAVRALHRRRGITDARLAELVEKRGIEDPRSPEVREFDRRHGISDAAGIRLSGGQTVDSRPPEIRELHRRHGITDARVAELVERRGISLD